MSDKPTRYPPIEDLVPHGPPLRMVEELIDWAPGRATCRLRVQPRSPFVIAGRLASVVTLEYMAQTVAACLGHEAFCAGGTVRVGMLVGVRHMELLVPFIAVGAEVRITVERLRGMDEVSTFQGETRVDNEIVSRARMTLVHAERPPA